MIIKWQCRLSPFPAFSFFTFSNYIFHWVTLPTRYSVSASWHWCLTLQCLSIIRMQIFLSYFMTWLCMSLSLLKSVASRDEKDFCLQQMFFFFSFHCLAHLPNCTPCCCFIASFSLNPPHGSVTANYYIKVYMTAICIWTFLAQIMHTNRWNSTWFRVLLCSSKTGLMTYQIKLRGDKWHRRCIGGKWK